MIYKIACDTLKSVIAFVYVLIFDAKVGNRITLIDSYILQHTFTIFFIYSHRFPNGRYDEL